MRKFSIAAVLAGIVISGQGLAQGTQVAFGGLAHDSSQPIEMSADRLEVNQADGSARFVGNVVIGQGEMRLTAGEVQVHYASGEGDNTGQIDMLIAFGGVTLVNGSEAAEAERAEYRVNDGIIVLSGDVLLTQGRNALSAESMQVDLSTGSAVLEGRVRTIFEPSDKK